MTRLRHLGATTALTVLVCFGGGQALTAIHNVVAPHELCAHGELVHDDHHDGGTDEEHTAAEAQQVAVSGEPVSELEHEHCDDTLGSREALAHEPARGGVQALSLRAALVEGQAHAMIPPAVALYRLAPKASPPI